MLLLAAQQCRGQHTALSRSSLQDAHMPTSPRNYIKKCNCSLSF